MAEVIMKGKGLQVEVEGKCSKCNNIIKVPRGLHMNGILCEECKKSD